MNKRGISRSAIILLLLIAVLALVYTTSQRDYVVLVSADGFRWDYPDMYGTPTLDSLKKRGASARHLIPSFPSKTFPNHYTLATGLHPDNHGLINNTFYAPELDKVYRIGDRSAVENPAFYSGEPVWSTASRQGIITASFFWVGSEAAVGGKQPDYWKRFDDSVPFEARIDTVIKWLSYPKSKRPRFITLYFEEPDAVAHSFGPDSDETGIAVQRIDSLIGVLSGKINKLRIGRRVNLIFLSDHGMTQTARDSYLNLLDYIPDYMIRRIDGSAPLYQLDPVNGYADSIIAILEPFDSLRVWKKSDIPPEFVFGKNPRIPGIIILADSGRVIGTRPPKPGYAGGDHGYDPAYSDMHALFIGTGPGFKKGSSIEELNNVDIYNLVCHLLNIEPSPNDGNKEGIVRLLK